MEASYGILSFIPILVIVIFAVTTKRVLLSLLCGVAAGAILLSKTQFVWTTIDTMIGVLATPDLMWFAVLACLFGGLIVLLQKSGGAMAFGDKLAGVSKGEKTALIFTWILGLVIFVEDYLNCLVVGSTMKNVTDRFKVPRELLAYIVDVTAAPVCILLPFSTWAIFAGTLLEGEGLAEAGGGVSYYIQSIPYAFYPMVALIMVPLVAIGVIPKIGPMRKAWIRAQETGVLAPEDHSGMQLIELDEAQITRSSVWNFIIPIIVLIGGTIYYDVDLLKGTTVALIVAVIMYLAQRLMTFKEVAEGMAEGAKSMLIPIIIVVAAFALQGINDELGLITYAVNGATPYLNGALLPVLTFIIVALLGFFTGSYWGTWAVSVPLVVPLAELSGAPLLLVLGAVWAGGGFGSHACPWGDATILASVGSGCDNFEHVKTQLPYVLIGAGITAILYLIAGFVMI